MTSFDCMGLPHALLQGLERLNFKVPTPIQAAAIPIAMAGHDVLGSAQTGTGKTAAFGLPLLAKLLAEPGSALVMTPTRELAAQVVQQLQAFATAFPERLKTALLVGGDGMQKQLRQLDQRPRLVVGTPGRIIDHLTRGSLSLKDTTFLVLDETDRMLDMGFAVQLRQVMEHVPNKPQTLLFSATMPQDMQKLARAYLQNPVDVAVDALSSPASNVEQAVVETTPDEKYTTLLHALDERQGSIVVFLKTKHGTERMAKKLVKAGHSVTALHGNLRQNKRDRVIAAFRKQTYRILVATDVAARGLDIPHVAHVINYDLPQRREDYVHRVGRTARAGAEGFALNILAGASDIQAWRGIQRWLNKEEDRADKPASKGPSRRRRRPGQGRPAQPRAQVRPSRTRSSRQRRD